jgi:hypothetical protein
VKYFKRKHNFDRFRKELKDLIHHTLQTHFSTTEAPSQVTSNNPDPTKASDLERIQADTIE